MKNTSIKVENITEKLVTNLRHLDDSYFPCPWSKESWDRCISNFDNYKLFIYSDESSHIIGFSLFNISKLDKLAHLLKIVINPKYRNKKVAYNVLSSNVLELSKIGLNKIFLEVEVTNSAAIGLYKKCGLKEIHIKKNFYGSDRHALIMMNYDL